MYVPSLTAVYAFAADCPCSAIASTSNTARRSKRALDDECLAEIGGATDRLASSPHTEMSNDDESENKRSKADLPCGEYLWVLVSTWSRCEVLVSHTGYSEGRNDLWKKMTGGFQILEVNVALGVSFMLGMGRFEAAIERKLYNQWIFVTDMQRYMDMSSNCLNRGVHVTDSSANVSPNLNFPLPGERGPACIVKVPSTNHCVVK